MADGAVQPVVPARRVPVARPLCAALEPAAHPLGPQELSAWRAAQQRSRKIRRAAGVARFNGWTVGSFAALTLLFGLFDASSLLLGLVLGVVAYNEFAGAALLSRLDARAPRRLALNQLGLCGVLVVYALWNIHASLAGPVGQALARLSDPQAAVLLGPIGGLHRMITLALYGGLIVGSLIFQGGTAWYYFTRGGHLRAHLGSTPQWILELQRTGDGP